MTAPSETLSPSLTFTSLTTPAKGEGISIVALSDSNEIRASSFLISSPGLTSNSTIGILLKSPISGTNTCLTSATLYPSPVHQCLKVNTYSAD